MGMQAPDDVSAEAGGGALAQAPDPHTPLRPQRRPRRQGQSAHRARHRAVRSGLCGHRRTAGHVRRRAGQPACQARRRQDAVATSRPDIVDRNGEMLATDVRTPSLFGEPHRIIDVDEAVELLTAVVPDLDARELRERLPRKQRLRLAQARDHAETARGDPSPGPARDRLSDGEQARLSERRSGFARRSATSMSTTRASPASRNGSTAAVSPTCISQASPPNGCRSRSSSRSICGCSTRCATNSFRRAKSSRPRRRPA